MGSVKADIFTSCRQGDKERVKFLVEKREVELNCRDKWDSTPLYYACLCGHYDLVEYLLSQGAKCDASTFDGERCIYGALTDKIKSLLLNYSVITATTKRREAFPEFLRRLFENKSMTDVRFQIHGQDFEAHSFVLSARNEYFKEQFNNRWKNKGVILIKHSLVNPSAFYSILEWIYCGEVKINVDLVEDIQRICKQCHLKQLSQAIDEVLQKSKSFVHSKRGMRIHQIQVNTQDCQQTLSADFEKLALQGFPPELRNSTPTEHEKHSHDVIFAVEGLHFKVHKVFFSLRSDYFRALMHNHFHEAIRDDQKDVLVVPIHDVSPMCFGEILRHIYSNKQQLNSDVVYEALVSADIFLLPSLKRQCGNFISTTIELENVISLLKTSRLFDLPRLEQLCTEFMAKHIEQLICDPNFKELVMQDAKSILNREEIDTIDIIDEIRYILKSEATSFVAIEDIQYKIHLINEYLINLGFDV